MPNGERWTITEPDEFTRIFEGIGLHLHADILALLQSYIDTQHVTLKDLDIKMNFIIEKKQWNILKARVSRARSHVLLEGKD